MDAILSNPYLQLILGIFIGGIITFLKMRKPAPQQSPFVEPLLNLAKDAYTVATSEYFAQINQLDSLPTLSAEERKMRYAMSEEYMAVATRLAEDLVYKLNRFNGDLSAEELVKSAQAKKTGKITGKITTVCL